MVVQDFIDLMMEPSQQLIEVYRLSDGKTIFHGDASECPGDVGAEEVESIDTVEGNKITFNV